MNAQNGNQNKKDPKIPSEGDYHVNPEFEKPPAPLPDQVVVDLAVEIMSSAPAESILQNVQDNWECLLVSFFFCYVHKTENM